MQGTGTTLELTFLDRPFDSEVAQSLVSRSWHDTTEILKTHRDFLVPDKLFVRAFEYAKNHRIEVTTWASSQNPVLTWQLDEDICEGPCYQIATLHRASKVQVVIRHGGNTVGFGRVTQNVLRKNKV